MTRTLLPDVALAALLLAVSLLIPATTAAAPKDEGAAPSTAGAPTLPLPKPAWYTDALHKQIVASGKKGVEVPLRRNDPTRQLVLDCLGTSPTATDPPGANAVSAGGCMVAPHGCTMNYVFTDGNASYIGTAGHCLEGGSDVVMQVGVRIDPTDTLFVTLARIGTTVKSYDSGIGRDFGLVKIDAGWPVVPGVAGVIGPTGVFCGDPLGQPVLHYGHGYAFAVGQGVPKEGEVIPDADLLFEFTSTQDGYNWAGYGLPGDSGSPVENAAGLAVGNLTHGIGIAGVPVPGLSFGTTMAGIFGLIGSGYSLVTVDGRAVNCGGLVGL